MEIRSVGRVRYKLRGKGLTKLGFVVYIQNCTSKGHFKFWLMYLFIIFDKTKGNLIHIEHYVLNVAKSTHLYTYQFICCHIKIPFRIINVLIHLFSHIFCMKNKLPETNSHRILITVKYSSLYSYVFDSRTLFWCQAYENYYCSSSISVFFPNFSARNI